MALCKYIKACLKWYNACFQMMIFWELEMETPPHTDIPQETYTFSQKVLHYSLSHSNYTKVLILSIGKYLKRQLLLVNNLWLVLFLSTFICI